MERAVKHRRGRDDGGAEQEQLQRRHLVKLVLEGAVIDQREGEGDVCRQRHGRADDELGDGDFGRQRAVVGSGRDVVSGEARRDQRHHSDDRQRLGLVVCVGP